MHPAACYHYLHQIGHFAGDHVVASGIMASALVDPGQNESVPCTEYSTYIPPVMTVSAIQSRYLVVTYYSKLSRHRSDCVFTIK